MRRCRRPLTKRETMSRAIRECSVALDKAYRHPAIAGSDLRQVLAAVFAIHIDQGASLILMAKGPQ
jgi:hypothetical protein